MGKLSLSKKSLKDASKAYYNSDNPIMSDAEYDAARDSLKAQEPDSDIVTDIGAEADDGLEKVKHEIPMGSLEKCSNLAELEEWMPSLGLHMSFKIDGLSISLKYAKGVLVDAVTRGDGIIGNRVMFSVGKIESIQKIDESFSGYVRGEIYLGKDDLKNINKIKSQRSEKIFKNTRNAASGIIRNEDSEFASMLKLFAFDIVVEEEFDTLTQKFQILKALGFSTPEVSTSDDHELNFEGIQIVYDAMKDLREGLQFGIDGFVCSIDDIKTQEKMGIQDNRPKWARALKLPAMQAITKIIDVEFTMGHTGALIPTAVLEPIDIDGTTISHALLCNEHEIKRLGICINDFVVISKRGDIIPKIESRAISVERPKDIRKIEFPDKCPYCGGPLEDVGCAVSCVSGDCPEKNIRKMISFASKMNIMHLGDASIRTLYNYKVATNVKELINLSSTMLQKVLGVNGFKIFMNLQEIKNKKAHEYIGSLGIENFGQRRVKQIIDALNIQSLDQFLAIQIKDLANIQGFGDKLAIAVVTGISEYRDMIKAMPTEIQFAVKTTSATQGSVCFTGGCKEYTRDQLTKMAEAQGYEVKDSVSSGLTTLVCQDPSSSSSKMQKAKKLGTVIVSYEDFISRLSK